VRRWGKMGGKINRGLGKTNKNVRSLNVPGEGRAAYAQGEEKGTQKVTIAELGS